MCLGIYVIRSLTRYRVGVLVGGEHVGGRPGLPTQVTVVWPKCQSGQESEVDNIFETFERVSNF